MRFNDLPGNVRGTIFALAAAAMFTVVSALVKFIGKDYHVAQILLFRQALMLIFVLPILLKSYPESLKTKRPGLHLLRLTGALAALTLSFTALANLPLATAISFSFTKTLFVTIIAATFLGELVGWRRVLAIAAGFIGMLIILRPEPGSAINSFALLAIAASIGAAIAVTSVRALTSTESTVTLVSYQAIFIGLLVAIPAAFTWQTPDLKGMIILVAIGLTSFIAQWLGVLSYRAGEVSVVTGMEYTKLIYASLIGIVIFAEWPDAKTLVGATIIISAAAFTIWRENISGKSQEPK